jgi:hypothetical protein
MRLALLPTLLLTAAAAADLRAQVQPAPAPAPPRDGVKGALGLGFTTQYFFRGIQQENQGVIFQPWVEVGWDVHESTETVRDVDLTFGLWNSLHDSRPGVLDGPWHEAAFYVDVPLQLGDRLWVGPRYTAYSSPNDAFDTVQELAFHARLDDRGMWFEGVDSGLQPSAAIAFELEGQRDGGDDRGVYLQVGIEPAIALGDAGELDLTLSLPVVFGFGLADYYEQIGGGDDDFFGYFDVGAVVTSALPFLPARMGKWTGDVGLHWLVLGDNNEDRNQGDSSELFVTVGMSTRF